MVDLPNAPNLTTRARDIGRTALLMGEVQGQGYIAQALGIANVLAVAYFHALNLRPEDPEREGSAWYQLYRIASSICSMAPWQTSATSNRVFGRCQSSCKARAALAASSSRACWRGGIEYAASAKDLRDLTSINTRVARSATTRSISPDLVRSRRARTLKPCERHCEATRSSACRPSNSAARRRLQPEVSIRQYLHQNN